MVLRTHPQHADAWHLFGLVAYDQGNPVAAEERVRRAIGFGAEHVTVWNNLGRALAAQKKYDDAAPSSTIRTTPTPT